MNSYDFTELSVGMEEHFQVQVTEEMMDQFRIITGDDNPLHADAVYAREKGYENKVVYGMLTASFLSTLAGVYLPGERSLIHSVETKFLKPVLAGDVLVVSGTVAELDERFSCLKLRVEIWNQKREKVLRGSMQIGVK